MAKETLKSAALALYMNATSPEAYIEAAHALAAALSTAPKPKADAPPNLTARIKPIKRAAAVTGVLAEWADGSATFQRVAYSAPGDRYAAAFQACDRLRRSRGGRILQRMAESAGVKTTIVGPLGVLYSAPEWFACLKAFPMPALASLTFEDNGESFMAVETYGAGDADECGQAFEALKGRSNAADPFDSLSDEWLHLLAFPPENFHRPGRFNRANHPAVAAYKARYDATVAGAGRERQRGRSR